MVAMNGQFYLEVFFLILVPAVAGPLVTHWVGEAAKRRGSAPPKVRGLRIAATVVWGSVLVAGVYVVLGPLSFLSTLTFSAILGIAATLALQTSLQNIMAGFILLRRRFLRLGDSIQISGLKGTVVSIGIVDTILKLDDGSLALVSNSTLLNGPLLNRTAATRLAGEY